MFNHLSKLFRPLAVVIAISALKDLFEDLKRHRSDKEENNRKTKVYRNKEFIDTPWQEITVGEVVKLSKNDSAPTDLLIIKSSEKKGICFIETKVS